MVFVFIAFGIFFGAAAAVFIFMSSGSVLLALASYSAVGTMATMALIAAVYFIGDADAPDTDWQESREPRKPASA
ncbi:MAG: hypothetical protein ACU0DI_15585 [Paracoccaceae bacterium]